MKLNEKSVPHQKPNCFTTGFPKVHLQSDEIPNNCLLGRKMNFTCIFFFSTAPLEHSFGIARMSNGDYNRMERLVLQFSRIDVPRLFLFIQ